MICLIASVAGLGMVAGPALATTKTPATKTVTTKSGNTKATTTVSTKGNTTTAKTTVVKTAAGTPRRLDRRIRRRREAKAEHESIATEMKEHKMAAAHHHAKSASTTKKAPTKKPA